MIPREEDGELREAELAGEALAEIIEEMSEGTVQQEPQKTKPAMAMLTASRLKDARACQRRHKHRYFDGFAPIEDVQPLRFGQLIHDALAAWWLAAPSHRLEPALAVIPNTAEPFDAAMARALIIGYDTRWADQALTTLAVEREFRCALVNPGTGAPSRTWELGGKIDALAEDADDRTLLVEHKTTISDITPGGEYWKRLRLDGQVSIYFEGARASGFDVATCLYDVLRKPSLRPLKATPPEARKYTKQGYLYANQRDADETPDQYFDRLCAAIAEDPMAYFQRGDVVRLDAEMADAMFDVWQLGRQIREADLAQRWPRNPDACTNYGRTCSFFGVCCGEESLDDTTRFQRLADPHAELSGVNHAG